MRKIILYIASSIDGKIAGPDGNVDWLNDVPNPDSNDYGYKKFYESVDTTLMGGTTYRQIQGFGIPFPYAGKMNYVITRDPLLKNNPNVRFISGDILLFVRHLKNQPGKNIWLIGGGPVNGWFLREGLIDEIQLFLMPVILGEGIPLFKGNVPGKKLTLGDTRIYASGVVCFHLIPEN